MAQASLPSTERVIAVLRMLTPRRDSRPDCPCYAQVVDKAGSAPYLLRQFYQRHLLRFQAVSSSLDSTARQKQRLAEVGSRPRHRQSAAEDAAEILGSLTGTNGQTPEEYISAVQPDREVPDQVGSVRQLAAIPPG